MCEDAACDGHREPPIRPELMAKVREIGEKNARDRGLTMEEYLDANYLVSPRNRFLLWLESVWLNLRLLKPYF